MVFPENAKWFVRLRIARAFRNMSQAAVAASVGVSRRTYGRYEAGEITPTQYARKKLAEVLEEPVETLFKGAKERK